MPPRRSFPLRLPPELLERLRRLAAREMRSLNAQIEYILRDWLRARGLLDDGEPPSERKSR